MKWLEIHIDTNHAGLELVEGFLSAQDIDNVVIDDETDFHDFLETNRQYWDYVDEELLEQRAGKSRITFYLPADEVGMAKLGAVRIALEEFRAQQQGQCGSLLMTMDAMEDADWENNWKQYYKPMEIGERLMVIPEWESADVGGRVPLILNPGLPFGTGSHATTRLCMPALEKTVRGGEQVLDLGCGSGILSIAALKLGAAHAFACDIDEKCETVAYENAALNGIDRADYDVRTGDILTDAGLQAEIGSGYDVVLANIVADVIIALAPAVGRLKKPEGLFICSGIIDDRAEEVAARLREAGLTIVESAESEGWFSYLCR